jgi:hypothetical protein
VTPPAARLKNIQCGKANAIDHPTPTMTGGHLILTLAYNIIYIYHRIPSNKRMVGFTSFYFIKEVPSILFPPSDLQDSSCVPAAGSESANLGSLRRCHETLGEGAAWRKENHGESKSKNGPAATATIPRKKMENSRSQMEWRLPLQRTIRKNKGRLVPMEQHAAIRFKKIAVIGKS